MTPSKLRVLVLSKRQYMSRDLLDDRYGRFRELPLAMAGLGAEVRGLCLGYRPRPEGSVEDRSPEAPGASVHWHSLGPSRLLPLGAGSYWRHLDALRERFHPDVVWACSDVPHAVLGRAAAKRLRARLVVDLYDNFESYPLARLPGVNAALRRVLRRADGVTCISAPLAQMLRERYCYAGPLEVLENAVPTGVFRPFDRGESRARLGLPPGALLVGTAGALSRTRGILCLLQAFEALASRRPDVHLVLAGPLDAGLRLPAHPRLHYLGLLPPEDVPRVLSALDVSVVSNIDSAFGRYCFPQKLYESLACAVPVAVARVGAAATLLRDYPGNLFEPGNAVDLARAIEGLGAAPVVPALPVPTWDELAARLLPFLARAGAA